MKASSKSRGWHFEKEDLSMKERSKRMSCTKAFSLVIALALLLTTLSPAVQAQGPQPVPVPTPPTVGGNYWGTPPPYSGGWNTPGYPGTYWGTPAPYYGGWNTPPSAAYPQQTPPPEPVPTPNATPLAGEIISQQWKSGKEPEPWLPIILVAGVAATAPAGAIGGTAIGTITIAAATAAGTVYTVYTVWQTYAANPDAVTWQHLKNRLRTKPERKEAARQFVGAANNNSPNMRCFEGKPDTQREGQYMILVDAFDAQNQVWRTIVAYYTRRPTIFWGTVLNEAGEWVNAGAWVNDQADTDTWEKVSLDRCQGAIREMAEKIQQMLEELNPGR